MLTRQVSDNPHYFRRIDETDDRDFYAVPRLVIHVDTHGSAALRKFYGSAMQPGDRVLDLMSAFRSHLPDDGEYGAVVGLGMNVTELLENPRLSSAVLQDLNRLPGLPFANASFDTCLISFSLQYLTRPVEVLAEVARVLRPGGAFHVAYTNRMFPTKAVAIWRSCSDFEKAKLIGGYLAEAGGFADIEAQPLVQEDSGFDPVYVVSARRA